MHPEPNQTLIDTLSAAVLRQQINRLLALAILQDASNGICPLCGDRITLYQVAVQSHGVACQVDFYHPTVELPCNFTIAEATR